MQCWVQKIFMMGMCLFMGHSQLIAQKTEIHSDQTALLEQIAKLEAEYSENSENALLGLTLAHQYYLSGSFSKAIPLYFTALDEDLLMDNDLQHLVHSLIENGELSQAKEVNAIIKERNLSDFALIQEVIEHKTGREPQTLQAYSYFKNATAPGSFRGNLTLRNAGGIQLEHRENDIRISQPLRIKGLNAEQILQGIIHPISEDLWLTQAMKTRTSISFSKKKKDIEYGSAAEFELSDKKSNYVHPCFNASGDVLIFASDMPGGLGGYDLYRSVWNDGVWSTPENLGAAVNSERDELHPYLDASNVLYFSSNGKPGLGGYDIYAADLEAEEFKLWHLAQPFNSSADDGGIVALSSERWFLSSNREGSYNVYQLAPKAIEPKTYYYKGRILDVSGKGISSVTLSIDEEGNHSEISSDASGNFVMSRKGLPSGKLSVSIQKQGYADTAYALIASDFEERLYSAKTNIIKLRIPLKKPDETSVGKKTEAPVKKEEPKLKPEAAQKVVQDSEQHEKKNDQATPPVTVATAYYAILSSSKKEAESNEFAQKMKGRYPTVMVLPSASGYYRVAIPLGNVQDEAVRSLREFRKVVADAWLLKQ